LEVAQRISIEIEDILETPAQALVVPTDSSLTRRDGVAATIHRAAGKELIELCRKVGPCAEGDAVLTPGFGLEGRFLIHVVLPHASRSKDDLVRVRKAYWEVLRICEENQIEIVSIPPIPFSEGGLNPVQAAYLALETMQKCLPNRDYPIRVRFSCPDERTLKSYRKAEAKLASLASVAS
jgi:O-acetyl-ADP-ribose deacetylase (regulator of RNase III)